MCYQWLDSEDYVTYKTTLEYRRLLNHLYKVLTYDIDD